MSDDIASYAHRLSRSEWAWEFLRRNPTYRAAWATWNDRAIAAKSAAGWGLAAPLDPSCSVPEVEERGDIILWAASCCQQISWRSIVLMPRTLLPRSRSHSSCWRLIFDKPVDQQLTQARNVLAALREAREIPSRKAATKAHESRWVDYVHVLDMTPRPALKEIAVRLFGDVKKIRLAHDTIRQAEEMRDRGYRLIISLE
jgi:Family of unknown function (DUF6499)